MGGMNKADLPSGRFPTQLRKCSCDHCEGRGRWGNHDECNPLFSLSYHRAIRNGNTGARQEQGDFQDIGKLLQVGEGKLIGRRLLDRPVTLWHRKHLTEKKGTTWDHLCWGKTTKPQSPAGKPLRARLSTQTYSPARASAPVGSGRLSCQGTNSTKERGILVGREGDVQTSRRSTFTSRSLFS